MMFTTLSDPTQLICCVAFELELESEGSKKNWFKVVSSKLKGIQSKFNRADEMTHIKHSLVFILNFNFFSLFPHFRAKIAIAIEYKHETTSLYCKRLFTLDPPPFIIFAILKQFSRFCGALWTSNFISSNKDQFWN